MTHDITLSNCLFCISACTVLAEEMRILTLHHLLLNSYDALSQESHTGFADLRDATHPRVFTETTATLYAGTGSPRHIRHIITLCRDGISIRGSVISLTVKLILTNESNEARNELPNFSTNQALSLSISSSESSRAFPLFLYAETFGLYGRGSNLPSAVSLMHVGAKNWCCWKVLLIYDKGTRGNISASSSCGKFGILHLFSIS